MEPILFTIETGTLDDKFLDKFENHLDYENIGGDEFYVLPKRIYDRFEDWAISSGYEPGEWFEVDDQGNELMENKKINLAENYERFFNVDLGEAIISESGESADRYYDGHDGWNKSAFEDLGLIEWLENVEAIGYEIGSGRRGSYGISGDTVDDLKSDLIEKMKELNAIINEI